MAARPSPKGKLWTWAKTGEKGPNIQENKALAAIHFYQEPYNHSHGALSLHAGRV